MEARAPRRLLGVALCCWLTQAAIAAGASLQASVKDSAGNSVADAVVVATPEGGGKSVEQGSSIVDQVDKEFMPYVSVIQAGSTVAFPNKDNVRHHVFSLSPAKKFELPLYAGTPAKPVLFENPGVVMLGCNIHDWMIAYLYVADSPYFGQSTPAGAVNIANLKPGKYQVHVWHPRMEGAEDATVQHIAVDSKSEIKLAFNIKLKKAFRPRRAPSAGNRSYR